MRNQIFHIFRNTPRGRETLRQAKYLADGLEMPLVAWIPDEQRINLVFGEHELLVTLDRTYLQEREGARKQVEELLEGETPYHFFTPNSFKDRGLPNIPTDFAIVSCPRVIAEHVGPSFGHVGIGHLGPAVAAVVRHAFGPVFIPAALFRPWTQVATIFDGSAPSARCLQASVGLATRLGMPLSIFAQPERGKTRELCERRLSEAVGHTELAAQGRIAVRWFEPGDLAQTLTEISEDALLLMDVVRHSAMLELFTGSKLATVQREWPGPLMLLGPEAQGSFGYVTRPTPARGTRTAEPTLLAAKTLVAKA